MTIDEWLDTRQPPPPQQLMAGVKLALGPALATDAVDAAPTFLAAAERLLRELVTAGETDRSVAASLLTIDALTTYALESASETVQSLDAFSDDAMTRLSGTRSPQDDPSKDA